MKIVCGSQDISIMSWCIIWCEQWTMQVVYAPDIWMHTNRQHGLKVWHSEKKEVQPQSLYKQACYQYNEQKIQFTATCSSKMF